MLHFVSGNIVLGNGKQLSWQMLAVSFVVDYAIF